MRRDLCLANLWINRQEQLKLLGFGAVRDALALLDRLDGDDSPTRQETVFRRLLLIRTGAGGRRPRVVKAGQVKERGEDVRQQENKP